MGLVPRFVLGPVLAGMAVAVAAQEDDSEPSYYLCSVERSGAFGQVRYAMDVPVDGRAPFHRFRWDPPRRPEGLKIWVQSDYWQPVGDWPDERATVFVYFETTARVRGKVRIEILRKPGEPAPSGFNGSRPFQRLFRWHGPGQTYRYTEAEMSWGELGAWMRGRDALTFALVDRRGTVMAEDRLEAATLAGAAEAIAAVRPELEAKVADYRNRCEEPPKIIVT